jgi:hypothetical protein
VFKDIQAQLEAERALHQKALDELRAYDPEKDPQISAKGKAINFVQGRLAELSRGIDSYRIAQLCLDNMEPVTTPAGPASPVRAVFPIPDGDDG